MADLWTAEDVEAVATAMVYRTRGALLKSDAVALADAVLAALAEAGRLLPAGCDVRERVRHYAASDRRERQQTWVGPWLPVDPEPAPPLLPPELAARVRAAEATGHTFGCMCPDCEAGMTPKEPQQ